MIYEDYDDPVEFESRSGEKIQSDGSFRGDPVFKVTDSDFYNNIRLSNKRRNFNTEKVKEYRATTRWRKSFWAQHETTGYMFNVKY